MAFFPKNIFHTSNTYNFEGKSLGYWIEIFGYWIMVFGSIASYFYYFPLLVSYWYGNLYRLITIPIRHFPYWQNRYICHYRYRNCIGRTLCNAGCDPYQSILQIKKNTFSEFRWIIVLFKKNREIDLYHFHEFFFLLGQYLLVLPRILLLMVQQMNSMED